MINPTSKILLWSHKGCLDGAACQLIIETIFKNCTTKLVSYSNIVIEISKTNFKEYDYVLFTDICPPDITLLDGINNFIILDHHESTRKFHNPKRNIFISKKYSGAKLTKLFFEKLFKIKLSHLDRIVEAVNNYDLWLPNKRLGEKLNTLFFEYWNEKFIDRFKDGNLNFTNEELKIIESKERKIQQDYDSLEVFEFSKINGCMISVINSVNNLCEKLLEDGYKIVINRNPKTGNNSIRSRIENFNVGNYLKTKNYGGGHATAGGFHEKNFTLFQDKVKQIVKDLYLNFLQIRR